MAVAATDAGSTKELFEHILGTIYGNCAGDAIGLLTEFMVKEEAKRYYGKHKKLEYEMKVPDMHRSRWENGDWTDDSDQMILIMLSLTDNDGKVNPVDFGQRLKNWMFHGFEECGDFGGLGIGATTHRVLSHHLFDTTPAEAAQAIWEKTGKFIAPNGSVMRTSILGIHDYKNIDTVISNTKEISNTTHADPRCQASCVAVTTAIAMMLQKKHVTKNKLNVEALIAESYQYAKDCLTIPEQVEELRFHMYAKNLKKLDLDEHKKIGYCLKCMGSAFWALRQKNFRDALQAITMEGGDADTNGAVAGALLGCKLGVKKIPETWRAGFCYKAWLDTQISGYLPVLDKVVGNSEDEGFANAFQTFQETK